MNDRMRSSSVVSVTADGLRRLAERARELESRLDRLRAAIEDGERSDDVVAAHRRTEQELVELQEFMTRATVVDDGPGDPEVVEIGDRVVIRLEDGSEETYVIVHAMEAAHDDRRVSLDAPLAQALLGRRVGEQVAITAPSGAYRCTILAATREVDVAPPP